jgi:hypothetical protein
MGFEAGMAWELPWWARWSASFFAVSPVCVVGKNARFFFCWVARFGGQRKARASVMRFNVESSTALSK